MMSRLLRPIFLSAGFILYGLGVGIAHYLDQPIDWGIAWSGLAWVIVCQLSVSSLGEYFRPVSQSFPTVETTGRQKATSGLDPFPRRSIGIVVYSCLAVLASLTVLMIATVSSNGIALFIMGILFMGGLFYYTPPIKLEVSGYGELIHAFLMAILVPIFGFLLQVAELNRLVAASVFPLWMIYLAMLIALDLPHYAENIRLGRNKITVRMGWQNAMNLHNVMIFCACFLFSVAVLFSLPEFLILLLLITLPIGLYEIWQMWRISQGDHPNWRLLRMTAMTLFGVSAYVLTMGFWIGKT